MSPARAAAWFLVVAACVCGIGLATAHAARARDRSVAARVEYARVGSALQRLATLDARLDPRLAPGSAQPLSTRLSAAAAQAGLPSTCISSVSPESQSVTTTDSSARILQRRAAVTLGSLTLPQFGRLLDQWRRANTDWIVTAIEITPATTPPPAAGGDLPLSISLTLESIATVDTGAGR
jgi:hypothetical protein